MFNPEEESQFNIKNAQNETTTQENYYNYSNSMTPYAYPRKRYKEDGCLPCQPKSYRKEKEKDNSCCNIFWNERKNKNLFFLFLYF